MDKEKRRKRKRERGRQQQKKTKILLNTGNQSLTEEIRKQDHNEKEIKKKLKCS